MCEVAIAFHGAQGHHDDVPLDGLDVAAAGHAPGPVADGDWALAASIDERADDRQAAALEAVFGGAAGGPMAAFAPLVGRHLGVRKAPIRYAVEGRTRSAETPGILRRAVAPLPTLPEGGEIGTSAGHPFAPNRLALAAGGPDSRYDDHGLRWDHSGRNGHYAPIRWSA